MAGVALRVLVEKLLTFKKVKLIFGHPVCIEIRYLRQRSESFRRIGAMFGAIKEFKIPWVQR